jgi:NADPH2:quinone reductase
MKALLCTELGSLDALSVHDLPSPRPGPLEVVVDVEASALNFPDALMVRGLYQMKPPLPFAPGMEIAGVVKEAGEGVTSLRAGDRVIGFPGYGGFAEEVAMPADRLTPLPSGLSFEVGAAFGLAYSTSLHALQECAGLAAGESLLVLGAAGGVGLAAVEIGKAMGARVIAAASTDEKLEACRRAGADELVNYAAGDLKQRLKEIGGERGIDVVYDPVGGSYSEPALRATAWGGRFLVVGFAAGDIPRIPLNLALLRERRILGVFWGEWARREPAAQARNLERLVAWIADGRIRPLVSERVGLAGAVGALQRMTRREVVGKVVVLPGQSG